MIQESLINCVEILFNEELVSKKEKERLIQGIIDGKRRAYDVVSYKLHKLASKAYVEGFKYEQ